VSQRPEFGFGFVGLQMAPWSVDGADTLDAAYAAPFTDEASKTGARRWPWMLPFAEPEAGGANRQTAASAALTDWDGAVNVIFGDSDDVPTGADGSPSTSAAPWASPRRRAVRPRNRAARSRTRPRPSLNGSRRGPATCGFEQTG
jgi:hypothetical protein